MFLRAPCPSSLSPTEAAVSHKALESVRKSCRTFSKLLLHREVLGRLCLVEGDLVAVSLLRAADILVFSLHVCMSDGGSNTHQVHHMMSSL